MEHYHIKLDKNGKVLECIENPNWNPLYLNQLWKREYYEGDFEDKTIDDVLKNAINQFKSSHE
jgi:hypothetical protein